MAKPGGYRLKRVSGSAIGKHSKKIVGCELCNFMHFHSNEFTESSYAINHEHEATSPELAKAKKLKTGDKCPRCASPSLRVFDSQAEFGRFRELKIMQDNGLITDLVCQVKYPLHAFCHATEKPVRIYSYVADFCYNEVLEDSAGVEYNRYIVEDVKPKGGLVTDVFSMKHKHFEAEYGIDLRIVER